MVPTLRSTLGVKGHRPGVGTWDCKDVLYVFGVLNLITGCVHRPTLESLQSVNRRSDSRKTQRMQHGFANHLRHVGKVYCCAEYQRGVLWIDNAPEHRGSPVKQALQENRHWELVRLPPSSPHSNLIERFWRVLRRRATHNRLFESIAKLKQTIRANLCYFQTLRHRVLTLIQRQRNRKKMRQN